MSTSVSDRWSALDHPQAVADAAERLRQTARTRSERLAQARWLETLAPCDGERLLDVGAGLGDMSLACARQMAPGGQVHALDLSPGLLKRGRAQARAEGLSERVHFHTGDARRLPYPNACFDAAFCRWVLLHLPDPATAVAEICRVVRPGGRILCVEVDWATLTVEPGDSRTTGQIVAANVARQVDGRSGAKLPALMRDAGLEQLSVTPLTTSDPDGEWLPFLQSRIAVAADAGVPRRQLERWWQAVQSGVRSGDYRFGFTQYGVTGMVPRQS